MASLAWLTGPAVFPWVALAFGLCIGSFLNVVIHRLPRMMEREWLLDIPAIVEESRETADPAEAKRIAGLLRQQVAHLEAESYSLVVPRSRCPKCGHKITALENIPLISYAVLRGRCAGCKAPISPRYPAVELLAGLGGFAAASHFGFGLAAVGAAVFIWSSLALALIDQETGLLPDGITMPLLWAGLLLSLAGAFVPVFDAVVGAVAGYLSLWFVYKLFKLLTGKEGMGYGDFKMNAAVGAFLGWKMLPLVILLSSVVGTVFGIAQMFGARRGWVWDFKFHFGPYLAMAGIVAMFWGRQIVDWYLR
jgi:leader peptidase (prepilin peptidase)/N-methyltransferase